jgi:hypothetical protein
MLLAACLQAIRTTTSVLEAAIAQAVPAGLSAEVADSLARQRCEQTPLLSAVTWALRQVCTELLVPVDGGNDCVRTSSRES